MKKIDCLGDMCPVPILSIQKELKAIKKGESIMLITDHSCTLTSLKDFCRMHQLTYECNEVMNGIWEVTIFDHLNKSSL